MKTTTHLMSIDTLKIFENLVESGMSQGTAKVLTENFRESQEIAISKLATKEDMQNLDKKLEERISSVNEKLDQIKLSAKEDVHNLDEKLNQKIDLVEQKIESKIQTLEYKLLTKIGAMITVSVAAVTWLNKIF